MLNIPLSSHSLAGPFKGAQVQSYLTLVSKIVCLFLIVFMASISSASAQLLGFKEAPGCEADADKFLPTLVICGRSPATGACEAYTKQCTLGDFVETGRRILIWAITIVLMILPVVIAYYGAIMILYHEFKPGGMSLAEIKKKILWLVIYFVCLLGAWIIVRTIVDLTQVQTNRINTFLIDENGKAIESRQFDFNR